MYKSKVCKQGIKSKMKIGKNRLYFNRCLGLSGANNRKISAGVPKYSLLELKKYQGTAAYDF